MKHTYKTPLLEETPAHIKTCCMLLLMSLLFAHPRHPNSCSRKG